VPNLGDAIRARDLASAERALAAGADPETLLDGGTTLLMHCALTGDAAGARLLLAHGADPARRDESGRSALDYARARGQAALGALLEQAAARRAVRWSQEDERLLASIWGPDLLASVKGRLAPTGAAAPSRAIAPEPRATEAGGAKPEPPAAEKRPDEEPIREEDLIGQAQAKAALKQVIALAQVNQERRRRGLKPAQVTLHAAFTGSPGTGKTTFARFYAQQIRALGLLERGHLVEVSRSDLVAEYAGQTAVRTAKVVESALGGVLFVDEAYALKQTKEDAFGQECIDTLVKEMEDHRDELVLIFAGYTDEMRQFLRHNTGLQSRVPNVVEFADFDDAELGKILDSFCAKAGIALAPELRRGAVEQIAAKRRGRGFGNAREVRNLFERALAQQSVRLAKSDLAALPREALCTLQYSDLTPDPEDDLATAPAVDPRGSGSALDGLQGLVGLAEVKREIRDLVELIRIERVRNPGRGLPELGLHMLFIGADGTGKRSVARLLATLLRELGLLASGHLLEVSRADLVAGYVGQTALKTAERIQEAQGGVLYVEGAPALARRGDSYGQEAIEALAAAAERHRKELVIILAGAPLEMELLTAAHPALAARFGMKLRFADPSDAELLEIALRMAGSDGYRVADAARAQIAARIAARRALEIPFAHARDVRQLLEQACKRQAQRLAGLGDPAQLSDEVLRSLEPQDFGEVAAPAPA
jgi:SpoVK/Ycf46/Vps4 family AAA+-type ATPase